MEERGQKQAKQNLSSKYLCSVLSVYYLCFSCVIVNQNDPWSNNNHAESFLPLGYVNWFWCVVHSSNTDSLGTIKGLYQSTCRLRAFLPEGIALAESVCGGTKTSVKKRHYKVVVGVPQCKKGLAQGLARRSIKGCWMRRDIEM